MGSLAAAFESSSTAGTLPWQLPGAVIRTLLVADAYLQIHHVRTVRAKMIACFCRVQHTVPLLFRNIRLWSTHVKRVPVGTDGGGACGASPFVLASVFASSSGAIHGARATCSLTTHRRHWR